MATVADHASLLDAALDTFAAQIAHQLGEASALLGAGLFVEGPAGERSTHAALERLQRFVGDLHELHIAGSVAACDRCVLADLAERAARHAGALPGGERLRVDYDRDLPDVEGDGDALESALSQLLRSAASSASRTVRVELRAAVRGDRVVVELEDDGGELSEGDAERLFDPFCRPRGRGPLVGAGVGLVVARSIVAAHGGTIEAVASPGGGACVRFDLPRAG